MEGGQAPPIHHHWGVCVAAGARLQRRDMFFCLHFTLRRHASIQLWPNEYGLRTLQGQIGKVLFLLLLAIQLP